MDSETDGMEFEIKDEVKEEIEDAEAEDALKNASSELKSDEKIDTEDLFSLPPPPTLAFELNAVKTGFDGEIQNRPRNSISNARLICPHCPKSFPNILRRRPNSFPTRKALEDHLLKQHAAEHDNTRVEFSCFTCAGDRNFMDQKSLDEHIKRHHINNVSVLLSRDRALLEFPHCTKFLVLDNDRNAHVPREDSDPLKIVPLATATPSVRTNMQLKILTMRLKCPHCDETFAQKFHLKQHMNRLHPEPEHRVRCPHCPLTFSPTESLEFQSHMLSFHNQAGSLRSLVKCPRCDETFCQKSQLETHMDRVHSVFEPHVTSPSPQESFVIQDLQQMQGEGESPDPRLRCPHCPLTFLLGQKRIFRSHMKKLHNEDCHLKSKSVEKCPQDAETLPLKSTLPAHIETVSFGSASRIKCPRCPLTFVRDQTLKCHMRKRHKEDPIDSIVWEAEPEQEPPDNLESQFKCPHCDKIFSQKCRLPNHIKRHHSGPGSQQIQCPQCQSKFSHNWSLQVHILTHHNKKRGDDIQDGEGEPSAKKPLLKCPHCATTFSVKTGKSAFTRHMKIFHSELNHNPVSRKNCPHCDRHFLSDRSLKRHIASIHLMQRKACHLCDKTYSTGSLFLLKKHLLEIHHEPKSQTLKCRYCNNEFLKPLELRHHIIETHIKQNKTAEKKNLSNPVKEQPSDCSKESEPKNSAKNQCQPPPRVPCPKCQLTFSNSKHLQFHIILQHVEKTKFLCLICTSRDQEGEGSSNPEANVGKKRQNFIFENERSLDKHMKSIHYTTHKQNTNLEKPPEKLRIVMPKNKICLICSKSFDGKYASSNYRGHMETHLCIKRYSCEHCSKKFTTKISLQAHLIRYHDYTSEQLNFKYACQLCPFITQNQVLLNYHMGRKHPGHNIQLQLGDQVNIDPETEPNLSDGNCKSKNMTKNSTQSTVCHVCSKIQTSKLDLIQHLKGHRGEGRFYCDLCPRDFAVRTHLMTHLNLDHHKSVYCNKCFTSFTDTVTRNQHVLHTDVRNANVNQGGGSPAAALANENSPASNLKCEICDESFKSPCLLKIHSISHLKEIQQQEMNFPDDDQVVFADNVFKCSACPSAFDRKSYLNAHVEIAHQIPRDMSRVKCSKCEQTYKFMNELKTHDLVVHSQKINQHINEKRSEPSASNCEFSFECSICLSKFGTQSELTNHQNQFGSEVLCHLCPATFVWKSRLNTHLRRIHGETDESNRSQSFLCHMCPSKFIHGHSLRRHVQNIHEGHEYESPRKSKTINSLKFSCRLCPEKFSRATDLRCHGRKVHDTKYNMSPDFCCHLCSCKYTRDQDLQRHVQRMHGSKSSSTTRNFNPENQSDEIIPVKKDEGFPCKLCSIFFVKKNGLLFHISDHHTDDALKPFECNICHRKYNAENILKVHMYDHHRHAPYFRCEVCFIRIRRRFRLKQHLKEKHNRPEYCETCKRSFETRADLDKHLEKNPSEAFPCRTCQTDYPSECLLTKHCNKLKHD